MQNLTIFTNLYADELNLLLKDKTQGTYTDEGVYCVVDRTRLDTEQLVSLMEKIVLQNNEIVNASEKLLAVMGRSVFQGKHALLLRDVEAFLDENDFLHLDGYIYFSLHEYSLRINSILYSVVKKSLYL